MIIYVLSIVHVYSHYITKKINVYSCIQLVTLHYGQCCSNFEPLTVLQKSLFNHIVVAFDYVSKNLLEFYFVIIRIQSNVIANRKNHEN